MLASDQLTISAPCETREPLRGRSGMKCSLSVPKICWRVVVLPMAFIVLASSSLSAQAPGGRSARDVRLRIETNRQTYRVGDSITVRLTLLNASSDTVRFLAGIPVRQARLRLCDAKGVEVKPVLNPASQDIVSRSILNLKPSGEMTMSWGGRAWLNLRDWGYDLRAPGRYTIVGIPAVASQDLAPDLATARSNRAEFTITR